MRSPQQIMAMLAELVEEVANDEIRNEFRLLLNMLALSIGIDESRKAVGT